VSVSVPVEKRASTSGFRAIFAPGSIQCSRPAIMRCSTSQSSPSKPIATRFPIRRSARTRFPTSSAGGGSTERKRNGEPIRSASSSAPSTRAPSASM